MGNTVSGVYIVAASYAAPTYPAPIAYWSLEEGTGTTAAGSTGGNTLTFAGASGWGGSRFGAGVALSNGVYLSGTSYPTLNAPMTVAAWIRGGTSKALVNGRGGVSGFSFGVQGTSISFTKEGVVDLVSDSVGATLNTDEHFITCVVNSDNTLDFYLDGAFVSHSSNTQAIINNNTGTFFVGADANSAGTPIYGAGTLNHVGLWNVAMTSNQVVRLYNARGRNPVATAYLADKFGALVHFGLNTYHPVTDSIPANYDVNNFNPSALDTDQWMSNLAAAGVKHALLTAKVYAGFCLWPTATYVPGNPPYSIAQSSWYAPNGSVDVFGSFVASCRKYGIKPGVYYNPRDLTYEARSGNTNTGDAAAYMIWIKNQLTELLSNYGPMVSIFLDGWGLTPDAGMPFSFLPYLDLYRFIRGLQPDCLVLASSEAHPEYNTQIEVYETQIVGQIPAGNKRPSEVTNTVLSGVTWNWYWHSGETVRSSAAIQAEIDNSLPNTACYLLGVAPNTTGVLPADQIAAISGLVI